VEQLRCHLERVVVKSDFIVGSPNALFHFRVGATVPEGAFVQIHNATRMGIVTEHAASALELGLHTQKALSSEGSEQLGEARTGEEGKGGAIESIGGLKGGLASLRELVYFSLVAPEALQRFSIEPPKGAILLAHTCTSL
jgi:ATP-dependent 26S proteasome regulatory subunit